MVVSTDDQNNLKFNIVYAAILAKEVCFKSFSSYALAILTGS